MNHLKSILLYTSAIVVILFSCFYAFIFLPIRDELNKLDREIAIAQSSIDSFDLGLYDHFTILERDNMYLSDKIQDFVYEISKDLTNHEIIYMLSDLKSHAQRNSLVFLKPIEAEYFRIYPVRLSIQTDYEGLKHVFFYLESLPIKLNITNLQFSSRKLSLNNSNTLEQNPLLGYNLNATMTVNFYVQSKVDDEI